VVDCDGVSGECEELSAIVLLSDAVESGVIDSVTLVDVVSDCEEVIDPLCVRRGVRVSCEVETLDETV